MAFQPPKERDAIMFGRIIAAILYYWAPKEIRDTDLSGMGES